MDLNWDLDKDASLDELFRSGVPHCHHCGAAAPEGVPDRQARCSSCGFHLHTCANCLFYSGTGCLIQSPYIWTESGVMGQDCPQFAWRSEGPLTEAELEKARRELGAADGNPPERDG